MYQMNDMKEVHMVIVRNNTNSQFTTYNFPLLTKVTTQQMQYLRVFEDMQAAQTASEQQWAERNKIAVEEARKMLQAMRRNKKT